MFRKRSFQRSAVIVRYLVLTILVGLNLIISRRAFAERLPQPGVAQMCEMADLVVEGDNRTADRVTVLRVWKAPPGWSKDTKELRVPVLSELDRKLNSLFSSAPQPKTLTTTSATLFLTRDRKIDAWVPLYTHKGAYSHQVSSCGVIWWDEKDCFLYTQNFSGVYSLTHWHFLTHGKPDLGPVTPQQLRKMIEAAFADNQRFQEDLAIADRHKRAEALVKYLMFRTSPETAANHRFAAEKGLRELGKDALPAIVTAIQAAPPGEEIHNLIVNLWSLKSDAAQATPILLKILERKDRNCSSCIAALEYIGDPANAIHIRPFLRMGNSTTHFVAARALAVLGDKESFEAIAELIPSQIKRNDIYEVKGLLNSLHALDAAKARPLAEKVAADPVMDPVRDQIEALKKR